jgi:hypothetical protein
VLFTFSKNPRDAHGDAAHVVRMAAKTLARKYHGCTAEVVTESSDGNVVTVKLGIAPEVESVECFEWFTQLLADQSMSLVRDRHFDDAMRRIGQGRSNVEAHR